MQSNARAQGTAKVALAPKISKELARVDWHKQTAAQIDRLYRGVSHQVRGTVIFGRNEY